MTGELASWLAIVGIALSAVVTRASFVVFGARLRLPGSVEQALRYAPAAVMGALVAPGLLLVDGQLSLTLANQRLLAALLASVVMWRSHSMLATIAAGMLALTLLRLYA
jgi:branched-subunit amino acid transport protein